MKLNLSENIKKFRKAKGMTQEGLADLLNISSAAISKWESNDTYPDITMLFPLARIFDVSVDELMGYDTAKIESNIKDVIEQYWEMYYQGKMQEATELIKRARKKYPNDYKIMLIYMWCIAGGAADNDPNILKENYDEFMNICNTVLNNCTDDLLRLDALNMKAKLFHALDNTEEALDIINKFPNWYHTAEQKTEQLFAKDTAEFKYWILKNQYELFDFAFNKLIKSIWYVEDISLEEKISKVNNFINSTSKLANNKGFEYFSYFASKACGEFCGKLAYLENTEEYIINFREKQLEFAKKAAMSMKNDKVLAEYAMVQTNGDYLKWLVNYFKNSEFKTLKKLRENKRFIELLEKYS